MIWVVIGAAFLGLFGTVLMCMLIVAGRADDVMESRNLDSFTTEPRIDTSPYPLQLPSMPDRIQGWTVVQPQQNPL
jgi:hypothetical protein